MTRSPEPGAGTYTVDRARGLVLVDPSRAGVTSDSRVVVHDHDEGATVLVDAVSAGHQWSIPVATVTPFRRYSVRIQVLVDERWTNVTAPQRLLDLGRWVVTSLSPIDWGVHTDCIVRLRHPHSGEVLARQVVRAGERADLVHEDPDGVKLQLDLHAGKDLRHPGERLLPSLRIVPTDQVGPPPEEVRYERGIGLTVRSDVTIGPALLKGAGGSGLATHGFIAVHSGSTPVPEAMEFVLGRQRYLYQDRAEALDRHPGRAIFLGLPHGSWGHFLTQGLSRIWYALDHPELPVVWNARSLPGYQTAVLDAIGFANEQIFVERPTSFDEMVFPFPGVSLGDYVLPEWIDAVGRVRPASPVPGKKLFISRSALGSGRGEMKGGSDDELERLLTSFGFEPIHPERLSVLHQLDELSSAEVVVGVEGSALHTFLLLEGPVRTRIRALTRHRGGSGVFAHLRKAKQLDYETYNVLAGEATSARDVLDLDLSALRSVLEATRGFDVRSPLASRYLETPSETQTNFEAHLRNTQVVLTKREAAVRDAYIALRRRDRSSALEHLASLI